MRLFIVLLLSVLTYSNSYTWLRTRRNYVRTFLIEKTIPTIRYSNSVGNSYSNSHSSYSRSGRIYSVRPTTFTTVDINTTPKKTVQLLVKDSNAEILEKLQQWQMNTSSVDKKLLEEWISSGEVYNNDANGIEKLLTTAQKIEFQTVKKPRRLATSSNVYVNMGTSDDPIFVKPSKVNAITNSESTVDDLELSGHAFRNISKLFLEENILSKGDKIAVRLRNEFKPNSKPYRQWLNKTAEYNTTSLTHVFNEYFNDHSVGDIGGDSIDYVPRRGYPGTLAPGENFKEDNAFEDLPKKILHPWPAMQEIPFACRWPPAHPMIPPPLLWFAMNDMFTENVTKTALTMEYNETIGGVLMQAKDAVRIARLSEIGRCYEPSEQIKHGGMIFTGGHKIPHYNPDHGPTQSDEEAEPPIPEELKPITERWLDPYFGMMKTFQKLDLTTEEELQAAEEEENRKRVAESLLAAPDDDNAVNEEIAPMWRVDEVNLRRSISEAVEMKIDEEIKEKDRLVKEAGIGILTEDEKIFPHHLERAVDVDKDEESKKKEIEVLEAKEKIRNRLKQLRNYEEISLGRHRGTKEIIQYTIESIRTLSQDNSDAVTHQNANKGLRKRKNRRKASGGFESSAGGSGGFDDF